MGSPHTLQPKQTMGNLESGVQRTIQVIDNDPTTWSLEHVEALWRRHQAGAHGFGLHRKELKDIVRAIFPDAKKDVVGDMIWPRFAEYDSGGEVNALEVLGGLAVVAQGSLEGKANFVLRLFDFNQVGSLSYDEVVVALLTVLAGCCLATRRGSLPQDEDVLQHADDAFRKAGRDSTMRVPLLDLEHWFVARCADLCRDRKLEVCDSPHTLLLCFDLMQASVIPDDDPAVVLAEATPATT